MAEISHYKKGRELNKKINLLLDSIERGDTGTKSIKERIVKNEERLEVIDQEISYIEDKIEKTPSEEKITAKAQLLKRMMKFRKLLLRN